MASAVRSCGLIGVVMLSACIRGSGQIPGVVGPTAAPTVYVGTVQDSQGGTGTLRVTLATFEGVTSGSWQMVFPPTPSGPTYTLLVSLDGTTLTGRAQMSSLDGTFSVIPDCKLRVNATVSATRFVGTYASEVIARCPERSGNYDLGLP